MRKRYLIPLLSSLLLTTLPHPAIATPPPKPEPAYAKWSRLAIATTKQRYPNAEVVDFRHVGRTAVSPAESRETFKLWLKQGTREWGVIVRISFRKTTEQVTAITFQETAR